MYQEERVQATIALRAQDIATSDAVGVGTITVLASSWHSTIIATIEGSAPTSPAIPRSVIATGEEEEPAVPNLSLGCSPRATGRTTFAASPTLSGWALELALTSVEVMLGLCFVAEVLIGRSDLRLKLFV